MTFDRKAFEALKASNVEAQAKDQTLMQLAYEFVAESNKYDYAYQWTWLGLPIIQLPQDILISQDLIWRNKPDIIIETGIAWGGSVILYAAILELIGRGQVIAIDTTLPEHIKEEIKKYKFSNRITLIEGDSIKPETIEEVRKYLKPGKSVSVFLDSNHTHEHVLNELRAYGQMVTMGQYLTVYGTAIDTLPPPAHRKRTWGPGNSPLSAIKKFLQETGRFQVDEYINKVPLCTFSPEGRLKCVQ